MPKTPFTVADYLLTRLKQLDVTEVFQIPGDYVKHFTQALENFDGVKAIGATNELDAAYAADAYGRTRGLAAVSLQFGVSTFSALNAIAGAYVERSPIVVISATPGSDARNITNMYGVLFHHSTGNLKTDQEVYEHVTVAAETLSTSAGAPEKIDYLLIAAITHKRPVYIACYKEVWGEPCPRPSNKPLQPLSVKSDPLALENAVDQAWTMITAAKNPMIFAGVEVLRYGLSELLQKLIDASGFLYTTTTLGKTVLDEKGDKFVGTYSDAASIDSVRQLITQGDCFLTLGTIITDDYLVFIESKYADMVLATTDQIRVGYFTYQGVTMKDFMEALLVRFKKSKGRTVFFRQRPGKLSDMKQARLAARSLEVENAHAIEQEYVDIIAFDPGPTHKFDTFDILPKWDYLALAQAFGAKGYRVTTIKELNAALNDLKKLNRQPALVEVVIPEKDLSQQMYRLGIE
jgi:indolepyruvate decarboxylase